MRIPSRRSSWEVLMMVGMLANAVARPMVMILDQAFALLGLIFTLIPLIMVALVWTRNHWLIALVTAVNAFFLLGAIGDPLVQSRLANPEATGYFVVVLLELGGITLTAVTGMGVLVQGFFARRPASTYRH